MCARTETQKSLNVPTDKGLCLGKAEKGSRICLVIRSLHGTPVGGKILNNETLRLNAVLSKGHSKVTQMKERIRDRK